MPDPKVLTEEEIHDTAANVPWCNPCMTDPASPACMHWECEFARRIESAVIAKRDAMWREAAAASCVAELAGLKPCDSQKGSLCCACRTVARMEER